MADEFDRRPPDFLLLTLAAGVRLEKGRQIHNGMQEQRREIHRRWVSQWRTLRHRAGLNQ